MSLKKRQATTELNHENWDDDDVKDDEDPMGKFKTAPAEELQKRVFKTARRRTLNASMESPGTNKSPFGSFTGFKKVPPSSFDFLANLTNGAAANGSSTTDNNSSPFGKLATLTPNQGTESPFGKLATLTPNQGTEENAQKPNQNLFSSPSSTSMFTPPKSDSKTTFTSSGFNFKSNKDDESSSSPSMLKNTSSTLFSNNTTTTSSNPVFGTNTSPFSSSNTPAATTNSVFGGSKPAPTLFSSSSTTPPSTSSKSVFGSTQNNTSLFSNTTSTPKASPFGSGTPSTLFTASQIATGSKESPFKINSTPTLSDRNADFSMKTSTIGSNPTQISSSVFGSNHKSLFSSTTTAENSSQKSQTVKDRLGPFSSSDKSCNTDTTDDKQDLICFAKLKALNQSVTAWIKKNVEETPCCILTPIFKDYEEHLKKIQKEFMLNHESDMGSNSTTSVSSIFGKQTETKTNSSDSQNKASLFKSNTDKPSFSAGNNTAASKPETAPSTGFSFGIKSSSTSLSSATNNTTPTNSFSFGIKSSPSTESAKPANETTPNNKTNSSAGFSFGMKPMTSNTNTSATAVSSPTNNFSFGMKSNDTTAKTTTSPSFSFGSKPATDQTATAPTTPSFSFKPPTENASENKPFAFDIGKPFSFNSNTIQKPAENKEEQKEDDDEPPKVEYTPVVEENSVYEKKCKVFVKKDGNFADKGVGTLYIKKVDDSGKHQILVRANNNLGTILLNFILSSGIPTQRMGKNNVMMVCIPTPESKPPPTPILIRVKTSEEADALLEELNKLKS